MNPITKRRATTCIALSALLTPVLAQEGLKTTPLGTIDFPPGYQTVMRLAEFAPGVAAIPIPVSRPTICSRGKRS